MADLRMQPAPEVLHDTHARSTPAHLPSPLAAL